MPQIDLCQVSFIEVQVRETPSSRFVFFTSLPTFERSLKHINLTESVIDQIS
jgi:hypothetical protein